MSHATGRVKIVVYSIMDIRSVTPPPRLSPKGAPLTAEEDKQIVDSQRNPANPLQVTFVGKKGNWDIISFFLPNGSGGSTKFYATVLHTNMRNEPVWYKYSTLADAQGAKTSVAGATNWALGGIEESRAAFGELGSAAASSVAKKVGTAGKLGFFGLGGARRKTRGRGRGRKSRKSRGRKSRRSRS